MLKGEINSTFAEVASTFNATQLPPPAVRTAQFCNNVDTCTLAARSSALLRPLHSFSSPSSLPSTSLVYPSNGTDSVRFRRPSTTHANCGRTPMLLEQLRFPLYNSTTRTFSPSMLGSSRAEARAHLRSLRLTRVFKLQPQTRDTIAWFVAYTYPPALMCLVIGAVGIAG